MIYGYIRVSTDKQTLKNQSFEIKKFCQQEQLDISQWIEETISGTTGINKRKLGNALSQLKQGDILIATEISRFGRNLLQVMSFLHLCMNKGIQVWTIKDNYRLGADIQSKVLAFAFGLSAEIERNLISQRTREALERLKADGCHLGRPRGKKNQQRKLDLHCQEIQLLLDRGFSISKIANRMDVHRMTLYRYIREHELGIGIF